jgi:hypothetical protein
MEVMLDLETLSTRGHATILAIAAIKFNSKTPVVDLEIMDTFFEKVKINSCMNLDMHIDEKTVKWWKEQDSKIYDEMFGEPRDELKNVLEKFRKWFGNCEKIWSHGATFDIPILSEAYSRCGLEVPWKFWNARDTRTLFDIANIRNKDLPSDNAHHPVHDCWRQIYGVKEAFIRLRK